MKKQIRAHEERNVKSAPTDGEPEPGSEPLPQYLLDRSNPGNAKALSSAVKNKRKEAVAKFSVPLPKVKSISEEDMFKAVTTGKKTSKKSWKRMITKPTFVGPDFTRRPVKYERFVSYRVPLDINLSLMSSVDTTDGSSIQEGQCDAQGIGGHSHASNM